MVLHQIFASPFSSPAVSLCIEGLAADDAILLLQEAVYALQHPIMQQLQLLPQPVYILRADALARGLHSVSHDDLYISDAQWLALTLTFENIVSW
ncbi:MAG: sulfurtransferase complex subunit TusB [Paraglaciecola sp.]|nr:sulfurtransferase complex subunit TusB [Paraglaciecola sp.]NCT48551.1 sulfurtransferase complex subunit TusB [Paraglaciecola sp.]